MALRCASKLSDRYAHLLGLGFVLCLQALRPLRSSLGPDFVMALRALRLFALTFGAWLRTASYTFKSLAIAASSLEALFNFEIYLTLPKPSSNLQVAPC